MRIHYFWFSIIFLTGCGKEVAPGTQRAQYSYPKLNESPLPPPPPAGSIAPALGSSGQISTTKNKQPPTVVTDNIGLKGEIEKMELIKQLRENAKQATTNNPFALTEQEIEEISKLDNPIIN